MFRPQQKRGLFPIILNTWSPILGKLLPQIFPGRYVRWLKGAKIHEHNTRGVLHLLPDGQGESPPWVMKQHIEDPSHSFGMTPALSFLLRGEILQMASFANFTL